MKEKFSTFEIQKALGIPRGRFQEWTNRGFINPSKRAMGQGDRASFTREDVYAVALFRSLIDSGFSREVAGSFIEAFAGLGKQEKEDTEFFEFRIAGGKISILAIGDDEPTIDVVTGSPIDKKSGLRLMTVPEFRIPWDRILLVNYRKVKKQADEALSILE